MIRLHNFSWQLDVNMGKLEVYVQRTWNLIHKKFLDVGTVLETASLCKHINTIVIVSGQKSGKLGHTLHCLRNLPCTNTKPSWIYTSVHAHWSHAILSVDIMYCKQRSENDSKNIDAMCTAKLSRFTGINGNRGQIVWHIMMNSKPLMAGST